MFGVCPALAQTSPVSEPASAALRVRGPAGCVQADAIESQVRQRSQRIQFVPAAANLLGLNVDVQRPAGRPVAVKLTVSWPDKRRSRRTLAADSCDEATSAVAFLIALTLDPAALTQPGAAKPLAGSGEAAGAVAPAPPPAAATAPVASAFGLDDLGRAATTERETPVSEASTPETSEDEITPAPDDDSRSFALEQIGFGVAAQLTSGVAPSRMPGVSASVWVALRGSGLFAPALQLGAAHVWTGERAQPGGVAAFQRTTVRLDLCPVGMRAGALGARACLTSAAGSLNAQGSASYSPRTSTRGWLDLGTSLLASLDLGPIFQIRGAMALVVPLRRDRFAFRPDVFHRGDVLCWEGHLGLGVRFP